MPVLTKINTNVIADDAVTSAKIPAGAVAADIGTDGITANEIAANAVGLSELQDATGVTADYHKVPVFADDAARDSAIGSPVNGMIIYNTNASALQQYNGAWAAIVPAPAITSISGFLNDDTDSTITVFGSNFNASSAVKMFTAASGGSQIGSDATTTFNSVAKLTAVFGAGSIGASGSTAYIEVDNSGVANRFTTAITVNADPTVTHAGATGTSANTTTHLGTYGGAGAGGGDDANTVVLLNFDRPNLSTDVEDSSNTGGTGHKIYVGNAYISTAQYKFGTAQGKANNSSCWFDGTGDVLQMTQADYGSTSLNFATSGAWTWDFFVRFTSIAAYDGILSFDCSSTNDIGVSMKSDSKIHLLSDTGAETSIVNSGTAHSLDTWYHVAFTHTGTTTRCYLDGVLVDTDTGWDGTPPTGGTFSPLMLAIGRYYAVSNEKYFHGYLDNIRIVNGTAHDIVGTPYTFAVPTALYGAATASVLPTITFTGTTTPALASDEDIEYTSVANTTKAANNQHLTDSGIGLTLTNLTGGDKSKATLTGTIASAGGTTHSNMIVKAQVRKTLGNAAYANASRVVTFSSSTTTAGLAPAMPVTGTGIPASTTITSVDTSTTITLSANPTGGTLTGQSLVFSDLTRITHINGSDTLNNADTMMTIATGAGGDPVLFNARRYVGTSAARSITGYGFKPDFVWMKKRNGATDSQLADSVRGQGNLLVSNGTNATEASTSSLTSFDVDGFGFNTGSSSYVNNANDRFIAYGWKAGGAPSGELVGSGATMSGTSGAGTIHNSATGVSNLTSLTQSVSQTSGFSITQFEGHASGGTFPHNLGGTPEFIIMKNIDSGSVNWTVWHKNLTATSQYTLFLNTNAAQGSYSDIWSSAPSSTTITCGTADGNGGIAATHICYAWKAVAGVSAFGTYTGNGGSATNTITYTGSNSFTARFIMIKVVSASNNWRMYDGFRDSGAEWTTALVANENYADYSNSTLGITPTSTGFTLDTGSTDGSINANTATYIYVAFA